MKTLLFGCALTLGVAAAAMPADAKGCIKGALIGGVAAHYASHHHGVLGSRPAAWSAVTWQSGIKRSRQIPSPPPQR